MSSEEYRGRVIVDMTDQQEQQDESSRERIIFPQHLQAMVASATKITIISDNAKAPPLSLWSPLFRKERGLPPLRRREPSYKSSSDGSRSRKPESRWDSMPQPKRLYDDIPDFPSLAKIRQLGYLGYFQGHEIAYGIPLPSAATTAASAAATSSSNVAGFDSPMNPPPPSMMMGATYNNNHDTNNNNNNENQAERGLNLPRRRGSIDVGGRNNEGVSLLSQVLSAFDLSEEEEEDEEGDNFVLPLPPPPPPPGRYMSPPPPSLASRRIMGDARPALSPEQAAAKGGSDKLNKPVRRESIDSVDFLLDEHDLEGLLSDEDDTEHGEYLHEDDDDDDDDEEEDDEDETEFYDETEDGEEDSDEADSDDAFHNHCKDDCTLVTATSATTSTTLSTLRSTNSRDETRR